MNWKKIRRKVRRFVRRRRHHLTLFCAAALIVLIMGLMFASGDHYDDFLDDLGMRESTNDYSAVNRFHYLGRYQLGSYALKDAGFLDESGGWTALANSYGIYSEADFLDSREGQDAAVKAYHIKLCAYLRANKLDTYIGSTYCGVKVTPSGLLAACHLVGIGSLIRGLESGQPVYDGNHISAAEYMELFAGYDISEVWNAS